MLYSSLKLIAIINCKVGSCRLKDLKDSRSCFCLSACQRKAAIDAGITVKLLNILPIEEWKCNDGCRLLTNNTFMMRQLSKTVPQHTSHSWRAAQLSLNEPEVSFLRRKVMLILQLDRQENLFCFITSKGTANKAHVTKACHFHEGRNHCCLFLSTSWSRT